MGANSRIEQVIDDIYEFIESCKAQAFSPSKIVVPKDQMYDLLEELRLRMPDEVKRYQKIIANRDALITDAEKKAEEICSEAREQAKQMVSDHEISRQAYEQANALIQDASEKAKRICRDAYEEAEQVRAGALKYTNDILGEVERVLSNAYETSRAKSEGMINTLKENLDIVLSNRAELNEQLEPVMAQEQAGGEDDFNFDENTFLEGDRRGGCGDGQIDSRERRI